MLWLLVRTDRELSKRDYQDSTRVYSLQRNTQRTLQEQPTGDIMPYLPTILSYLLPAILAVTVGIKIGYTFANAELTQYKLQQTSARESLQKDLQLTSRKLLDEQKKHTILLQKTQRNHRDNLRAATANYRSDGCELPIDTVRVLRESVRSSNSGHTQ